MSFCSCSAVNVTGNRPMSAAELAEETHSRTNQVSAGAVLCFSPFQAATRSARNVSLKKCDGRCQDLAIRRHALPLWSGSWPPNPILHSPPAQEGWENRRSSLTESWARANSECCSSFYSRAARGHLLGRHRVSSLARQQEGNTSAVRCLTKKVKIVVNPRSSRISWRSVNGHPAPPAVQKTLQTFKTASQIGEDKVVTNTARETPSLKQLVALLEKKKVIKPEKSIKLLK